MRSDNPSGGSWSVFGTPWDAFGQLLAALGSPGATPDRLWGVIWASKNRPERVRTRPRNGFGCRNRPQIDFSSIFRRLRLRFHGFSVDCSLFVRSNFLPPAFCVAPEDSEPTTRRLRASNQTTSKTRRFRVASFVSLLQLARTTSIIYLTSCELTFDSLPQGKYT